MTARLVRSLAPKRQQRVHVGQGFVTGVLATQRVNVVYRGTRIPNVPCLDSYTGRKAGDRVNLVFVGQQATVLGRYGHGAFTFGAGLNQVVPIEAKVWRNTLEKGDLVNKPAQGDPDGGGAFLGAWAYGTNLATALSTTAEVAVALTLSRSFTDGGRDLVAPQVHLHNYNTFTGPPTIQMSDVWTPFMLARGESKTASVPPTWLSALQADTSRGFAIYSEYEKDYMIAGPGSGLVTLVV